MIDALSRFAVVFAAAVITYLISYAAYRRTSTAFWGYFSAWALQTPMFFLFITGAKSVSGFDVFLNTLCVPVLAAIMVIADILLIEVAMLGILKPLKFFLPKGFSKVFGIHNAIRSLQKYHAIPEPDRLGAVFVVSMLGGLMDFVALFVAGAFF